MKSQVKGTSPAVDASFDADTVSVEQDPAPGDREDAPEHQPHPDVGDIGSVEQRSNGELEDGWREFDQRLRAAMFRQCEGRTSQIILPGDPDYPEQCSE